MDELTEYTINGYAMLDDIESRIREKEAGGFKFRGNTIKNDTNIIAFEKLPFGQRPQKDIVFREGQAPGGDGLVQLWNGKVHTSKGTVTVFAYR
ncbi:MAG: hypothetical protein JWR40_2246 [Massilia sp.]|nr:hypothetical protein [Massilia sp.]MDB5952566.1 hypothetical protein [Massilia sp.]